MQALPPASDPDSPLGSGSSSSSTQEVECRICRDSTPPLHTSCRCNTHVHTSCLHRWLCYRSDAQFPLLSQRAATTCEVCRHPFRAEVLPEAKGEATNLMSVCRTCDYLVSVEGCLAVFLFVMAVMGHIIFVLGMYKGAESEEFSVQRIALGVINAILTLSLLVLVQKMVSRWLRETDFTVAWPNALPFGGDVETGFMGSGRRCGFVCHVLLGGVLAIAAVAEIFFLARQLPLGAFV